MIDHTNTLNEIRLNLALSCWGDMDAPMLIKSADLAASGCMPAISAESEYVHMLWSWLEKTDIRIYAKLIEKTKHGSPGKKTKDRDWDAAGAKLSEKINSTFKNGADAVQLMVDKEDLGGFVSALFPVRGDLFFGRKLFIGLDLGKIDYFDWEEIFYQIEKIGADGILLDAQIANSKGRNKDQNTDDTIGRLYGLFDALPPEYSGKIQFSGLDIAGLESAWRLCQKMRPDMTGNLLFFIDATSYKL